MTIRRVAVFLVVAIAAVAVWFMQAPVKHKLPEPDLYVHESDSAEFMYRDIVVDGWHLSYTYAVRVHNPEDMHQIAHYGKDDLRTVRAELTDSETAELVALVKQSKFLNLNKEYGGTLDGRAYPEEIAVKLDGRQTNVTYLSANGAGSPMPDAFVRVRTTLFDLVEAKFHKKCE